MLNTYSYDNYETVVFGRKQGKLTVKPQKTLHYHRIDGIKMKTYCVNKKR